VFRRGSNVLEYWLDHAEGFEIRYRRRIRGRVESVVVECSSGRAQALVVRSRRLHRRRMIPVESIVAVDPFAGVLVPRRERTALVRIGAATGRLAVAVVGVTVASARSTVAWTGPRLGTGLTAGGRGIRSAAGVVAAATAWLTPRAWRLATAASRRCASGARRAGRRLAQTTQTTYAWMRPRVSTLAHATGARLRSMIRRLVRETSAAEAWLEPRLAAAAAGLGAGAAAAARHCSRSMVTCTRVSAAWLGPRLRASIDAAGTGTPSAWHLSDRDPIPGPTETRERSSPTRRD
jgi:hypothetical protein